MRSPSPRARRRTVNWLRALALTAWGVESLAAGTELLARHDVLPTAMDLALICLGLVSAALLVALETKFRMLARHARSDADELQRWRAAHAHIALERSRTRSGIEHILRSSEQPEIHYQPIVRLTDGVIVGYEALSRFIVGSPEDWFRGAAAVDLGVSLELHAIRRSLMGMTRAFLDGEYLSINCSPATAASQGLVDLLQRHNPSRIVIELTEHSQIAEYRTLRPAMDRLRGMGVRLAVDDAGSGYASLQHILRLSPQIIKLDRTFVEGIAGSPAQCGMIQSLVDFCKITHAAIVAEGIETRTQLEIVRRLGVTHGQGYLLGAPQPLPFRARTGQRIAELIAVVGRHESRAAVLCRSVDCLSGISREERENAEAPSCPQAAKLASQRRPRSPGSTSQRAVGDGALLRGLSGASG